MLEKSLKKHVSMIVINIISSGRTEVRDIDIGEPLSRPYMELEKDKSLSGR